MILTNKLKKWSFVNFIKIRYAAIPNEKVEKKRSILEVFVIEKSNFSRISESCMEKLKSKPLRIGLPFIPTPSSRFLAKSYYLNKKRILNSILQVLNKKKIKNNLSKKIKSNIPIDVPDLSFKGPF